MIRVLMPQHLRTLARVQGEVELSMASPITIQDLLDALENRYPMLRGTIRDPGTKKRRPFIRFFACEQDFSNESSGTLLPQAVCTGEEPFLIVGAIAGG